MVSVRNEKNRRDQFVTTTVNDAYMADNNEADINDVGEYIQKGQTQYETTGKPSGEHKNMNFAATKSLIDRVNFQFLGLFGVGLFAGMVLAMVILCCRRRKRQSQRWKTRKLKPSTNEIQFKDEYETSDESLSSAENGRDNHPIDRNDWLAGVGFEKKDEGKAHPFVFAEKVISDSSSSYGGDDENDEGLFHALNGKSSSANRTSRMTLDSPPRSSRVTLDSPPHSSRLSPRGLLGSSVISPPTVSELFQNTISSHWKVAPPISLGGDGSSVSSRGSNGRINKKLAAERDELNKSLFLLNDQILEQQRKLGASSEKSRHHEITKTIRVLEGNKADIELKLKSVRSKIKSHKEERRRKL